MDSAEIRKKFLGFFEAYGHAVVSSSSLVPDDPSVLLTTAGMQQFKKYYTGELDALKDFKNANGVATKDAASIQKCFRTSDIDEVGDETHLTFFEMLGNFSFGGYWKKEAITLAHDFITKELGLAISYVTVFKGSDAVPKDEESKAIWRALGMKEENIREEGMDDVFWGPTGASGPCGPTTEIYCRAADGKEVEIWNIVFNEFFCSGSREELLAGAHSKSGGSAAKLTPLETKGIDTGMGLERLAMIAGGKTTIFETDLFSSIIKSLPESAFITEKMRRIFADHARGITFLVSDGVRPSNKDAGYILRRLMRRVITYIYLHRRERGGDRGEGINLGVLIAATVAFYHPFYPDLDEATVRAVVMEESAKFEKTVGNGIRELAKAPRLDAATAFHLYESYGLPYEIIKEFGIDKAAELRREDFDAEFKKHQERSRAGAEKKFGGHGLILDTGELKAGNEEELKKVLRLHTATHLLQGALREVLGDEVRQKGSDITPERTRFDYSFPRKMTPAEIARVEKIVNEKIAEDLPVGFKEMPKAEAEKLGALHFLKERYPETVKVYYIGRDINSAWSKEFCGGPHVAHTGEIGHFRIAKDEAVAAGVRRVRGVVK